MCFLIMEALGHQGEILVVYWSEEFRATTIAAFPTLSDFQVIYRVKTW